MKEFNQAINLLGSGNTCVIFSEKKILTFNQRGIKPLMLVIENKTDVVGFNLADKIVGKAVAMLAVKLNIKKVYGEVMSKSGAEILKRHNIEYFYGTLTDKIINREGTGICPMEDTVKDIDDIETAYIKLKNKLKILSKT